MSINLPLRRTGASAASALPSKTTYICSQCRHATLLRRPKRPYTFTQLITLSDGSTFVHRTSSPAPIYRSTRDTRNSLLWNPSSSKLLSVEEDEAGRLAAFRARFGRGFDASTGNAETVGTTTSSTSSAETTLGDDKKSAEQIRAEQEAADAARAQAEAEIQEEEDNLLDLISSFGQQEQDQQSGKKK